MQVDEVPIVDIGEITIRTDENFEFKVENRSGHMNCFLNSALQLIWSLCQATERESLTAFIQGGTENGPILLQPLMKTLKEFFNQAATPTEAFQVPTLESNDVRRELFKLFYKQEAFDLNLKADSFEAFDFLLTSIHSWVRQCSENPGQAQ